jgi:glycerol-3-phosphate dehydrogenase
MNREAAIERLRSETFDCLVIGGGATGAGIAVDAASRGLRVALIERDDFGSGTSSRSTKLIHGGVRYLEQAVLHFDRSQFNLVRDALKERAILLSIAPHLCQPLPLVTPLYNLLHVPYYRTGLKLYDWLAGKANLSPSRFVDTHEALARFPMLKSDGLRGGVVYFDGQFDDARLNLSLILTADQEGAAVANRVEIIGLLKKGRQLCAAALRDTLNGKEWEIRTSVIINATGPFTDSIRLMDDPAAVPIVSVSSGAHIILPKRFSPPDTGLLIPQTEDGRVLFLLPWLNHTLVGTTDNPSEVVRDPKATEDDVAYLLRHLEKYFSTPISKNDVTASWSGLRPLVSNPSASDTADLSRDHIINISPSGLITVAGGKWTTYRKMALDAVDAAIKLGGFSKVGPSRTETLSLFGAKAFTPDIAKQLTESHGLASDVARHLARAYGDRAVDVAELASGGLGARLANGQPFVEAEVVYAARTECARSGTDVLTRRTRLGVLDETAASEAAPRVSRLLGEELSWTAEEIAEDCISTLESLGH